MEVLPRLLAHYNLQEEDICQQISDGHIQNLALSKCTKWRSLPAYLGLQSSVVDDINRNLTAIDEGEKRKMFLSTWKKDKGIDATYKSLICAMLEVRCREEAEGLMKLLGDSVRNGTTAVSEPPHNTAATNGTSEKPCFDADAKAKCDANITLEDPPREGTREYNELQKHCSQVEIILHTVNDNENIAALTYMKSPSEDVESNGVQNFPNVGMVVGVFAKKNVVLIQTDPGESCEEMVKETIDCFPSAQYILAVGVCYGFDRKKHLFGDVLVSKQISDFKNSKVKADGTIENRGETKDVADFLSKVFCKRCTFSPPFKVTDTRDAKVYAGPFLSRPVLMDNKSERDKFHAAAPTAIGGEMEGGVLMKLAKQEPTLNGVIIIKGVVDYGDGMKNKDWQFTTAMAAFQYTETKLKSVNIPQRKQA